MRAVLALAVLCACAAPRAATKVEAPSETNARRAKVIDAIGGMKAFSDLLRPDDQDGPLRAGEALEAAAQGREADAARLAREALAADPGNAARKRLVDVLAKASATEPAVRETPAETLPESIPRVAGTPGAEESRPEPARPSPNDDARRSRLIERVGGLDAFGELLRADDLDGPLLAGQALEAYAQASELKAVLLGQAALGADPGNGARRRLLKALEELTGIAPDPEGLLPLAALVQHELARAETAFFERRFGAALQACRRALLLSPDERQAWLRLGSSHFALGDEARAREAWGRVRDDAALARFLNERGWTGPEMNR